ncbi:hypothetical protein JQC92_05355 [Shewanella sp. 202IG2-18]|uniref:hypothetical protein n=1 Tax=Parashewanella hymeniacidonis TaxID=2807618 RepID=UPI0019611328|nr:hypothetical protein [Parashewanella hymeniacidonis]MBM7071464.1 hypothetical protein [Parashewanella hymeniacidonis]
MSGTVSAGFLNSQRFQISMHETDHSKGVSFEMKELASDDNVVVKVVKALINRFFGLNQSQVEDGVKTLVNSKTDKGCFRAMSNLNESLKPAKGVKVTYTIDYDENGQNPEATYILNIPGADPIELNRVPADCDALRNHIEHLNGNFRELKRRTTHHPRAEEVKAQLRFTMGKQHETIHELKVQAETLCRILNTEKSIGKYQVFDETVGDTYNQYLQCPDNSYYLLKSMPNWGGDELPVKTRAEKREARRNRVLRERNIPEHCRLARKVEKYSPKRMHTLA